MVRASSAVLAFVTLIGVGCSDRNQPMETARRGDVAAAPARDDDRITREIEAALQSERSLSERARQVDVSTEEGVVTLQGSVENDSERAAVEAIARDVDGVKRVENQLVSTRPPAGS